MRAEYYPLSRECKSVKGGIKTSEILTLTIETEGETVRLLLRPDGGEYALYPMKKTGNRFSADISIKTAGLYYYAFSVDNVRLGAAADFYGEGYGNLAENGEDFQLTVYDAAYSTPAWFKGGVVYQIFPDRFRRAAPSTEKTDGTAATSAAASANAGTASVKTAPVSPEKTNAPAPKTSAPENSEIPADLSASGRRIKRWGEEPDYLPVGGKILNGDFFGGNFRGMTESLGYLASLGVTAVYLNPVFKARSNHRYDTGDYMQFDPLLGTERDFTEFVGRAAELGIRVILDGVFNHTGDDSVYFNKYGAYPSVGAYNSPESPYYNWFTFYKYPDSYSSWWGIDTLPQTNESDPSFVKFITGSRGVLAKYLAMGVGGWRIDVADELPPAFLRAVRSSVKKHSSDAVIIGEVWENVTDKISYGERRSYFQGKELDGAMNYPLKDGIISFLKTGRAVELVRVMRTQLDCYPKPSLDCMLGILATHDTARLINVLAADCPDGRARQALPLTPEEYERGLSLAAMAAVLEFTLYGVPCVYYGEEIGMSGWGDPFNRRCMEWGKSSSLLELYRKLGCLRRRAVFTDGDTLIEHVGARNVVFCRKKGTSCVHVAANAGFNTLVLRFSTQAENLLTGERANEFTVPPMTVAVIGEE